MSRRRLLTNVFGAGLTLWTPGLARAAAGTDVLLLSCMDYRLMDDIAGYMASRGLAGKYDHIVLAGASLGVLNQRNAAWGQTFWDHVAVALELHHIRKVMVIDHRDCGAYKVFLGADHDGDAVAELEAHASQLRELRRDIHRRHEQLEVELLLMDLEGQVEAIA